MTPLTFLFASTAVFAVLAVWFSYEERTRARLFRTPRAYLDACIDTWHYRQYQLVTRFGSGSLLILLYTMALAFLLLLRKGLEQLLQSVEQLARRNMRGQKQIAENRATLQASGSPLAQIAAHKAAVSLTDKQKADKRQAHLEGRV